MGDSRGPLLTIVGGNSTLDLRIAAGGARRSFAAGTAGAEAIAAALHDLAPSRVVAVTVVANLAARLREAAALAAVPLRFAGRDVPCPLPLDYTTPHTLGADRWVAALAAHRRFGRSVVIDCGTATTVNLVEQDGTFRGGAIAPGLRAFVVGMAAVTPALPAPCLDAEPPMPPRSSQDAVDAGVLFGFCGLVERLTADVLRVASGPASIVVTGGNAPRLLRHARLRATHIPDLVHDGLVLLDANP